MLYNKKCRAASCYHCPSFPCLQVPAFQKGSGGESWSLNFHIWLLLEEHVEQLTGWCNPIRPHSYACYHHSAAQPSHYTQRREQPRSTHAHTNKCTTHTILIPHPLLFTSLARQTCQQGVQPNSAWLLAWQDTMLQKRQTTSLPACLHVY